MEETLEVDGNSIRAEFVEKPWVRNSYLRFRDDKLIVISRSRRAGERLVSKYGQWISKHYAEIKGSIRLFEYGSVFYRSKKYSVRHVVTDSGARADLDGDTLLLYARDGAAADRLMDRMLMEDAARAAEEIAAEKASAIGVRFSEIKARRYRKWGTCKSNGAITVNYCLSMLPRELQEYVVSHEVAHLKHMDHSRKFWGVVSQLCPDYKDLRKRLRAYDSTRRPAYLPAANLA